MSDMKCPFCGEKLQQTFSFNPKRFWCSNYYNHKHPINLQGTKELWQALIDTKELLDIECSEHEMCHTQMLKTTEKLERTRKALDVAVDALKDIRCIYTGDQTTKPSTMFGRAAGALNKITALEQKDE